MRSILLCSCLGLLLSIESVATDSNAETRSDIDRIITNNLNRYQEEGDSKEKYRLGKRVFRLRASKELCEYALADSSLYQGCINTALREDNFGESDLCKFAASTYLKKDCKSLEIDLLEKQKKLGLDAEKRRKMRVISCNKNSDALEKLKENLVQLRAFSAGRNSDEKKAIQSADVESAAMFVQSSNKLGVKDSGVTGAKTIGGRN